MEVKNNSLDNLERSSYRHLQQMAKSMNLPSNVKKVYLIEMIYAKEYSSPTVLENIVKRVKQERKRISQARKGRKKRIQAAEISSTSNSRSPPITVTPKRPGHYVIQYSPNIQQTILKYNPKPTAIHTHSTTVQNTYLPVKTQTASDRVLRSFNTKVIRNPNYRVANTNNLIGVIRAANPLTISKETQTNHNIIPRKINVGGIQKYRPSILINNAKVCLKTSNGQLLPIQRRMKTSPQRPARRERTISGIYPLNQPEKSYYEFIPSVGFRRRDGRLSKINALVQKPLTQQNYKAKIKTPTKPNEISIQDIIDYNIDNQQLGNTDGTTESNAERESQYPNMSVLTDVLPQNYLDTPMSLEQNLNETCKENNFDMPFSVYYHKKIRAEQVRTQRTNQRESVKVNVEERLPKIADVFSKFNEMEFRPATQPIYVQVSDEFERVPSYPFHMSNTNQNSTSLLENLFNFKNQFLTNQPLMQVATTANTKCVFSTPTISTAVALAPTAAARALAHSRVRVDSVQPLYERDSQYQYNDDIEAMRSYDFLKLTDQQDSSFRNDFRCNEVLSTSSSSIGTSLETSNSQELGANVTIPEMVEDALEIISQDGDYMERIGMDVRMQCILCSWAGPKIILELHIRKDHSNEIQKQDRNEWNITYTLGSLVQMPLWLSRVVEYDSSLYILSAKYEDPDYFMAILSTLPSDTDIPKTGKITLYNKVTGEPYMWEGEIQQLPHTLPYHTESNCLKLEISKMNLLPNSANLQLINRELVIKSPNKVVVGHPELNDIHIIIFVKLSN